MKNKISVVTSTYAHYGVEETMESVSKIGLEFIELIDVPDFGSHVSLDKSKTQDTLDLCKKYNLGMEALGAGYGRLGKPDGINTFKNIIDVASLLGISIIDADVGTIKNDADKAQFYKDINILGDYGSEKGVKIGLEPHGDWYCNGKNAAEIVKKINHPNIKVTYDTANVIFYGNTRPEEDIKHVLPYLGHLHLKDKSGEPKSYDFPILGEGYLDFDKIMSQVKDYDGLISLEIELDGKDKPIEIVHDAVKESYEFLKKYL